MNDRNFRINSIKQGWNLKFDKLFHSHQHPNLNRRKEVITFKLLSSIEHPTTLVLCKLLQVKPVNLL